MHTLNLVNLEFLVRVIMAIALRFDSLTDIHIKFLVSEAKLLLIWFRMWQTVIRNFDKRLWNTKRVGNGVQFSNGNIGKRSEVAARVSENAEVA